MQQDISIKIIVDTWNTQLSRTAKLFDSLTDEQLQKEVAPGRNTGVYLLGHLIAVHDAILPLFGLEEKLYPELEEPFIKNPDKSGLAIPSIQSLRKYWIDVHTILANHFASILADDWFQKHNAVSTEDFAKEPHRNRLNVLVNRTNHLSYHYGQIAFLNNTTE